MLKPGPERADRKRLARDKADAVAFLAALRETEHPPASLNLRENVPSRITPPDPASWLGSPAGMCADKGDDRQAWVR